MHARAHRPPWLALLAGVFVVALMLRLWNLGSYEPNQDELIYMAGINDTFAHPPLFAWILAAATSGARDLAIQRLPSLVIGMIGMACLVAFFASRRDWGSAAWIAVWCAVSLHHLRLCQTIKGFVLLFTLVAASHLLLARVLEAPTRGRKVLYGSTLPLILWADYIGLGVVLADLALLYWRGQRRFAFGCAALCAAASLPLLPWVWEGISIIREQYVLPWPTLMGRAGTIFFGINDAAVFVGATVGILVLAAWRGQPRTNDLVFKLLVTWGFLGILHLAHLHIEGRHLTLVLPLWGLLLAALLAQAPTALRVGSLLLYSALQLQYLPQYLDQTPVPYHQESWYQHQTWARTYQFGRLLAAEGFSGHVALIDRGAGMAREGLLLGLASSPAADGEIVRVRRFAVGGKRELPADVTHVFVADPIERAKLDAIGLFERCHQRSVPLLQAPYQSFWECRPSEP